MSASAPCSQVDILRVLRASDHPLTCPEILRQLEGIHYNYEGDTTPTSKVYSKLMILFKQGYVEQIRTVREVRWRPLI